MNLSVIVPLYNEAKRAPDFLKRLQKYDNKSWEFILVNDGSTDSTLEVAKSFKFRNRKIVSYKKNKGKAFAIKKGVEESKGKYIIFIDADGSIDPSQIGIMLDYLEKYDVVVGTRASKLSDVKQPLFRKILGMSFNLYVNLLFNTRIMDHLCGFKGFKRNAAKMLFESLVSSRWIFDVELFYKIRRSKYTLYQLPIKWEYRGDSKMKLTDPIKIALDLIPLRFRL